MHVDEVIHPAGVLVQPGRPFGGLPLPASVEPVALRIMVGELTAVTAPAQDPQRWPGGARGTVLLLPGFAGSKEDFLPVLEPLAADGWNVWAVSQRGQADSVAPAGIGAYGMEDLVTDLLQVADIVGDGAPIHVVGHSFGGLVARSAAIRVPTAFASLTFLSSGPKCWTEEIAGLVRVVEEVGSLGMWEGQHAELLAGDVPLTPAQELERLRAASTSSDCLVGMLLDLMEEPDLTVPLLHTGVPVLVTHGSADDGWPHRWQEVMARALGAEYVVIEGAGHLPPQDSPQVCADLLSAFFDLVVERSESRPATDLADLSGDPFR